MVIVAGHLVVDSSQRQSYRQLHPGRRTGPSGTRLPRLLDHSRPAGPGTRKHPQVARPACCRPSVPVRDPLVGNQRPGWNHAGAPSR